MASRRCSACGTAFKGKGMKDRHLSHLWSVHRWRTSVDSAEFERAVKTLKHYGTLGPYIVWTTDTQSAGSAESSKEGSD